MGAWGEGLYDDDEALDVRDSFKVLAKLPDNGDRIMEILLDEYGYTSDLKEDGSPTFWLAVADQVEKRGIACSKAIQMGIEVIESGADLEDLQSRGMEPSGIKARTKILEKLLYRFKNPRPIKKKRTAESLPMVVLRQVKYIRTQQWMAKDLMLGFRVGKTQILYLMVGAHW